MNKGKDFLFAIPALCGAKNPSRYSRVIQLVFDDEIKNADSPFKRNAEDVNDPENRMAVLFGFDGDEGAIDQCKRLVRIMELSHYKKHHGENVVDELEKLITASVENESDYPQIKEALTVDEAVSAETWNP